MKNKLAAREGYQKFLLALTAVFSAGHLAGLTAQEVAIRPPVPLTADTCARVTDGDVVTFQWNPDFDHVGALEGLRRFELTFDRPVDRPLVRRGSPPQLRLIADPRSHGQAPDSPGREIEKGENGFFAMRFTVRLAQLPPGDYQLVDASADPVVTPGYHGAPLRMNNSPTSLPFCLIVSSRPARSH